MCVAAVFLRPEGLRYATGTLGVSVAYRHEFGRPQFFAYDCLNCVPVRNPDESCANQAYPKLLHSRFLFALFYSVDIFRSSGAM
jgi:hypothetical protein